MSLTNRAAHRNTVAAIASVFAMSCGGAPDAPGAPNGPSGPITPVVTVTSVAIAPQTISLVAVGGTAPLTASVLTSAGVAASPSVQWSSSNTSVATVSGTGPSATVTAVANGVATITATSSDKSATATVTVNIPVTVVSVSIAPATVSLVAAAATQQFTATVLTSAGIAASPTVQWSSSNTAVATISGGGATAVVTAIANGTANITATSADKTGNAAITVNIPAPVASVTVTKAPDLMRAGETAQLIATLRAADGSTLNGRTITWSTSSTLSATVSQSGLVTAVAPYDSVRITATAEGKSATTTTIVYAAALRTVANFGSNPGNLTFYEGGPAIATPHPLVVILHGCNMNAAAMETTGWTEFAHRHAFTVLYGESTGFTCFQFSDSLHTRRGKGHAASIVSAVNWAIANRNVNPSRVYITGFSGGGIMTANMIASYPDVFAAASIMEGAPARCADAVINTLACNLSIDLTPSAWGDLVRNMAGQPGAPYPRVSIWQGDVDNIVLPANATELMEQWTNVHGIDQTADVTSTMGTAIRREYRDAQNVTRVETWTLPGWGHAIPVMSSQKCGYHFFWTLDSTVCHTEWSARFFGLIP